MEDSKTGNLTAANGGTDIEACFALLCKEVPKASLNVDSSQFILEEDVRQAESIRDLANELKSLCSLNEAKLKMIREKSRFSNQVINENLEPKTPTSQIARASEKYNEANNAGPSSTTKDILVQESLKYINHANKKELMELTGIGEKRATSILKIRQKSSEPFEKLDDLQAIGLSKKKIDELLIDFAAKLFS